MDRNYDFFITQLPHPAGQARKSLWIETGHGTFHSPRELGQARKSLWIETFHLVRDKHLVFGQARKSLWIETATVTSFAPIIRVRLVRACGSKL